MNRSGYSDDHDEWAMIRWRGAVKKAIEGSRGQEFLKDLLNTLDSMSEKKLIAGYVSANGEVCALGSILVKRNIDMTDIEESFKEAELDGYIDEEWLTDELSGHLNIAGALVREIEFVNDEEAPANPYKRFEYVRKWVINHIKVEV